jgi:mRNA interferase MazF
LGLKKGEVWWARLRPPAGRRPVLLLSRDEAYAVRTAVTVAPLTTTMRGIPVEVPLGEADGLPRRCAINLDSVLTIPMTYLEERITRLSPEKLEEVRRALFFALDL